MLVNKINVSNFNVIKKEIPIKSLSATEFYFDNVNLKIETLDNISLTPNTTFYLSRKTNKEEVLSTPLVVKKDLYNEDYFIVNYNFLVPIKIIKSYNDSGYLYILTKEIDKKYIGQEIKIQLMESKDGVFAPYYLNATVISNTILRTDYTPNTEEKLINDLIELKASIINEDFINYDNKTLKDNIKILKNENLINIKVPFENCISLDLHKEDNVTSIYEEKKKEVIPSIIDYEKKMFSPYFYTSTNKLKRAEKIIINLYFRDRDNKNEWTSNDALGWVQRPRPNIVPQKDAIKEGDLLGYLNFTDNDVYFQKMKLSKSFIRLSYYDTNINGKQMLLNYSTVFIDTNKMFSNFVKWSDIKHDWRESEDNKDKQIILEMDTNSLFKNVKVDERISSRFVIYDRFNKDHSSEGFYIYLYESLLNGEKDKNGFTDIYMKIDFNHAKYGRTVPFILPHLNDKPLHLYNSSFPVNFMKKNQQGVDILDMASYYDAMNINLKIKYDETLNEFIYIFPYCDYDESENAIILNVVEPRINEVI